jgi:hypothetical protein
VKQGISSDGVRRLTRLFLGFAFLSCLAFFSQPGFTQDGSKSDLQKLESNSRADSQIYCDGPYLLGTIPDSFLFQKMDGVTQDAWIERLRVLESGCLRSAGFYAILGQWLLVTHHPRDAIEALERSLLIEPEQAGVQLDFALALAESGSAVIAKALTDQIMKRPDVPLALKEKINELTSTELSQKKDKEGSNIEVSSAKREGLLSIKELGSEEVWGMSGNVQMMLGYDNNLNSASFVNTVNLTLPNGIVPLTLDPSSLPRGGSTLVASSQIMAQRPWGEHQLIMSGSWMGRDTPQDPSLSFHNEEFLASLKPKSDLGWHFKSVLNHFELGASNFYNGLSMTTWKQTEGFGFDRQEASSVASENTGSASSIDINARLSGPGLTLSDALICFNKWGAEVDRRTYAQDASQNGLYAGLLIGGLCKKNRSQFNLVFQSGVDWASDKSRVGGNQNRQDLRFQSFKSFEKSRVGVEIGQQWLKDSTTYSDLLGGIERKTQRNSFRLSYQYQIAEKLSMIAGDLNWVTSIERQAFRSTIGLFNLRGDSVQTGLKWEF